MSLSCSCYLVPHNDSSHGQKCCVIMVDCIDPVVYVVGFTLVG